MSLLSATSIRSLRPLMYRARGVLPVHITEMAPTSEDAITDRDVEYLARCVKGGKEEASLAEFFHKKRPKDKAARLASAASEIAGKCVMYLKGLLLLHKMATRKAEADPALLVDGTRFRFPVSMCAICDLTLVDVDLVKFYGQKIHTPIGGDSDVGRLASARSIHEARRLHLDHAETRPLFSRVCPPSVQSVLHHSGRLLSSTIQWYLSAPGARRKAMEGLMVEASVEDRWCRRSTDRSGQADRLPSPHADGYETGAFKSYPVFCVRQPFSLASSACLDAFDFALSLERQKEARTGERADPKSAAHAALRIIWQHRYYTNTLSSGSSSDLSLYVSATARRRFVLLTQSVDPSAVAFLAEQKVPLRVLRTLDESNVDQVREGVEAVRAAA